MSVGTKSPIVALIASVFLALALAGGAYYLLQKERGKSATLQVELEDIKGKQKVTELKLEESKKSALDLEAKLKDAQGLIDVLKRKLEQEGTDKEQALTKIGELQGELDKQKELRLDL
jgi:uncharacterized protein HemX